MKKADECLTGNKRLYFYCVETNRFNFFVSVCSIFELFSSSLKLTASSHSAHSVLPPQAVLHNEYEEKHETTDHGGYAKTKESISDLVFEAVDAARSGAIRSRIPVEVEEGGLADAGAVIFVLEVNDPIQQLGEVLLRLEVLGEGAEFK